MTIETPFVREDVVNTLLTNELVNVYFTKVNGEYREMNCTLHPERLKFFDEAVVDAGSYDANQVRVFDVDIKEWRSFLMTNLIELTVKS